MPHPRPLLHDDEEAAWFGFLQFHSLVTRELDTQLMVAHGMGLVEYEVLLKVSIAGGRMRMSELAEAALLSRSGLTRIVDELERAGLITREHDDGDGRVLLATLTPAGRRRFDAARRTHLASVRHLFLEPLSPAERRALGPIWERLIDNLPSDTPRRRRPAGRAAARPR